MKPIFKTIASLAAVVFLAGPISADMAQQPQVVFTKGLENTFAADWQGVEGRIYFMQWSLDLQTWFYAPFIDFGDGMHSRGTAGTSDKAFYRLHCIDDPAITSLDEAMAADFDGDGLSNIFEVTYGYGPYDTASTVDGPDASLDPDEDGLSNVTELAAGSDPTGKDNGLLNLEVSVN